MDSIASIMSAEHDEIEEMVRRYKESPTYMNFKSLSNLLERHMYIEENAIYNLLDEKTVEDYSAIMNLLEEHDTLLRMLLSAQHVLFKGGRIDAEGILGILDRHKNYENEMFYPLLDRVLTDSQKKQIMENISGLQPKT